MVGHWSPEPLSHEEALALVRGRELGRVIASRNALPHVWPVRYALVGGLVAFPAIPDLELTSRAGPAIVGFHVDDAVDDRQPGWSVMMVGPLQALPRRVSIGSLSVEHAVALLPEVVSGVRADGGDGR